MMNVQIELKLAPATTTITSTVARRWELTLALARRVQFCCYCTGNTVIMGALHNDSDRWMESCAMGTVEIHSCSLKGSAIWISIKNGRFVKGKSFTEGWETEVLMTELVISHANTSCQIWLPSFGSLPSNMSPSRSYSVLVLPALYFRPWWAYGSMGFVGSFAVQNKIIKRTNALWVAYTGQRMTAAKTTTTVTVL